MVDRGQLGDADDDALFSAVARNPNKAAGGKGAYVPPSRRNLSGDGALKNVGKGPAAGAASGVEELRKFQKVFKLVGQGAALRCRPRCAVVPAAALSPFRLCAPCRTPLTRRYSPFR